MTYKYNIKVSTHSDENSTDKAIYYFEGICNPSDSYTNINITNDTANNVEDSHSNQIEFQNLQNHIEGRVKTAPIVIYEIAQKSDQEGDNFISRFYLETHFNLNKNNQERYKADLEMGGYKSHRSFEQKDDASTIQNIIDTMFQEMKQNNLSDNNKSTLDELKTVIGSIYNDDISINTDAGS